jgi:hypothetical protein
LLALADGCLRGGIEDAVVWGVAAEGRRRHVVERIGRTALAGGYLWFGVQSLVRGVLEDGCLRRVVERIVVGGYLWHSVEGDLVRGFLRDGCLRRLIPTTSRGVLKDGCLRCGVDRIAGVVFADGRLRCVAERIGRGALASGGVEGAVALTGVLRRGRCGFLQDLGGRRGRIVERCVVPSLTGFPGRNGAGRVADHIALVALARVLETPHAVNLLDPC